MQTMSANKLGHIQKIKAILPFLPNKSKSTDNLNPTESSDIRYKVGGQTNASLSNNEIPQRQTVQSTGRESGSVRTATAENQSRRNDYNERSRFTEALETDTESKLKDISVSGISLIEVDNSDYNAEMTDIADSNKKLGLTTSFFVKPALNPSQNSVNGFIVGKHIYVRYDDSISPQTINAHEVAHAKSNTAQFRRVQNMLKNNFSVPEQKAIRDKYL